MNRFTKILGLAVIAAAGGFTVQAQNTQPILTMRSGVAVTNAENEFKFTLTSTENTTIEVEVNNEKTSYEVKPGTYNVTARKLNGTEISCLPGVAGTVKVYGDASKIQGLESNGYELEAIDLQSLPALTVLDLDNNTLSSVDLTGNAALENLTLAYNNLTTLDLSQNPALVSVKLDYNNLRELPLVNNPKIEILDLSQNYFSFVTLPAPQPGYTSYKYAQKPIVMNSSYPIDKPLSFGAWAAREGTTFTLTPYIYDMFTNTSEELPVDYYMVQNTSDIQFTKEINDSVFVRIENSLFPAAAIDTKCFYLKTPDEQDKPNLRIMFATTQRSSGEDNIPVKFFVGIKGATPENPVAFYVDYSGGRNIEDMAEYEATSEYFDGTFSIDRNIGKYSNSVDIYTEDDVNISSFVIKDVPLYYLDPGRAPTTEELIVNNCVLDEIDLSYNNGLRYVDLSDNALTGGLSLYPAHEAVMKNNLQTVIVRNSAMTGIGLTNRGKLKYVDVSHNNIKDIDLSDARQLEYFDASYNLMEELDLNSLTSCGTIDISHNQLSTVLMPLSGTPEKLDLSYNNFGIALLPNSKAPTYFYAPQNKVDLPKKSPSADLRDQYRTINGQVTQYEWYKADGTPIPESKYEIHDGATTFRDATLGNVYCMMSHPAFPDFTGDNRLRTTEMLVTELPTNVLADFTSLKTGGQILVQLRTASGGNEFYVDWDGTNLVFDTTVPEQSGDESNWTWYFKGKSVAGAKVRVLSANNDVDKVTVFSVSSQTDLEDADLTKMTNVTHLSFSGGKAKNIKLPENKVIRELGLDGNQYTEFDPSIYPSLQWIGLGYNQLTSFDTSKCPQLYGIGLDGNPIKEMTFTSMPELWQMSMVSCGVEKVDISNLPKLQNCVLMDNPLHTLDVSKNKEIKGLWISNCKFDLTTLPLRQSTWAVYSYTPQADITVPVDANRVDMSSQLWVGDTRSEFTWWYGKPYWDDYYEMWIGEELERDIDYVEYDGVTTFLLKQKGVVGMATNTEFPRYGATTAKMNIEELKYSGVEEMETASEFNVIAGRGVILAAGSEGSMDVYDLSGAHVASARFADGRAEVRNLQAGMYVVRAAGQAVKVMVK